jgi:glycosyltransferase involved in cell wall biosynthesis
MGKRKSRQAKLPLASSPTSNVDRGPKFCLNMIVKNEAHIVHELIHSVSRYLEYWVIVDTGSSDGTQDKISHLMDELSIPGEMHQREWVNFGYNRTQALHLAQGKSSYIWVMDADDLLVGDIDFPDLSADVYYMPIKDTLTYWRAQLFKDAVPFRYDGVLHEVAKCDMPVTEKKLIGNYYIHSRRLGGRNLNPNKYSDDAKILHAEVVNDPSNSRNVFYLAQSYLNAGQNEEAISWYSKRIELGGWEEEVYYSMYAIGIARQRQNCPWSQCLDSYLEGWNYRPIRIECLYQIVLFYRGQSKYSLGYFFALQASKIPVPQNDILFVRADLYEWRILDELAVCASWINKKLETFEICSSLLNKNSIPDDDLKRIYGNRIMCVPHMSALTLEYSLAVQQFIPSPLGDISFFVDNLTSADDSFVTINSMINCFGSLERVKSVEVNASSLNFEQKYHMIERNRFLTIYDDFAGLGFLGVLQRLLASTTADYIFYATAGDHLFCMPRIWDRLYGLLDLNSSIVQAGLGVLDSSNSSSHQPYCEPQASQPSGLSFGEPCAFSFCISQMPSVFHVSRLRTFLGENKSIHVQPVSARLLIADYLSPNG